MKILFVSVIILTLLFTNLFAEEPTVEQGISSLGPTAKDLPEWETLGEPKYVIGDKLYQLIDGGADIYHEYGFKQAVS